MRNWKQSRELYVNNHLSQQLANPERRLNALKVIERIFKVKYPQPLLDENIFSNISKVYLLKLYECLKEKPLTGAEKSVFNGLYKFAK